MREVKNYLGLSQILLLGLLLICSFIVPSVAISNGGASNFGNHLSTVVLYILSFSLCSFFLILAAVKLIQMSRSLRIVAGLLLLLSLLYMLVLISTFPRRISWTYSVIHDDLAIILFAYEFLLSLWLVVKPNNINVIAAFLIELGGSFIALLTVLNFFNLLFVGQTVAGLGFALLLITRLPYKAELILTKKKL